MNLLSAYGLLAHGVIFGAMFTLLPLGPLRERVALGATAVALLMGIAPVMLGLFGTPSLTLLCLALLQLADRKLSSGAFRPALALVLFALPYYATSLGMGSFDPYALGYQPSILLYALMPLGLALWWKRQDGWLLILAADLAGYASGLFVNLWEALFDPLLVLVALLVVIRQGFIRLLARKALSGSAIR